MNVKHVWIVMQMNSEAEPSDLGSFRTKAAAQRNYEDLQKGWPSVRFAIRCETVAQPSKPGRVWS